MINNFIKKNWRTLIHLPFDLLGIEDYGYQVEAYIFTRKDIWESKVSKKILKIKGKVFFDVGACYGRYSILVKNNFQKIYAFEPYPPNIEIIEKLINKNKLFNITVIPYAISDRDAEAYLTTPKFNDWGKISENRTGIKIITKKLDSIINGLTVDLIKVDVEGYEWQVLQGANNSLELINSWIIELHNIDRKQELENYMTQKNYTVEWIDDRHVFAYYP